MAVLQNKSVGGKLFDEVMGFAVNNDCGRFFADVDKQNFQKVFSDDSLVTSCISLFENDLNVSLAAQNLYMHRNTLIYRIKKIEKLIGLNVTRFADAVTFLILFYSYANGKEKV